MATKVITQMVFISSHFHQVQSGDFSRRK